MESWEDALERLTRLEERQISNKSILNDIRDDVAKVDKKVDIQNGRVRKLEDWNNKAIGMIAIVVILSNLFGSVILKLFFK
jgi:hypothetical protein